MDLRHGAFAIMAVSYAEAWDHITQWAEIRLRQVFDDVGGDPTPREGLRLFGILLSVFGACDKALDTFREVIVEMRCLSGQCVRSDRFGRGAAMS